MSRITKAIILAGGQGLRLRPLTNNIPKCLLKVGYYTILEIQMRWLWKHGVEHIIIAGGHGADALMDFIARKIWEEPGRKSVSLIIEHEKLGTSGAVFNIFRHFREEDLDSFFVVNGDILTDLDPQRLVDKLEARTLCVMSAVEMRSPYGIIQHDNDTVIGFAEKPVLKNIWINAGVYLFRNNIRRYLVSKGDLETDVFPKLASLRKIKLVKYSDVFWMSIDTVKDLKYANEHANEIIERILG